MANYWAHTLEVVGSSEGQCHKIFQLDHISCILRWRFRKSGSWVLKTKWKFGENYPEAPESRQNWLYRTFGLPERCINHSNEFWIVPGPFQSVPWPVANFRFVLKSRPRLRRSPCFLRGLRGLSGPVPGVVQYAGKRLLEWFYRECIPLYTKKQPMR